MHAIRGLAARKTVVLISHRLANVVDADYIYVMQKGCVAERGSHEELLAQTGGYARLWRAQKELEEFGVDSWEVVSNG